jgi:hypothetical protein
MRPLKLFFLNVKQLMGALGTFTPDVVRTVLSDSGNDIQMKAVRVRLARCLRQSV